MFYKKTLCIWYEKGKCRNGEKCRFAHGLRELRAREQLAADMERAGAERLRAREQLAADMERAEFSVKGKGGHPKASKAGSPQAPQGKGMNSCVSISDPMQINPSDLMLTAASLMPRQHPARVHDVQNGHAVEQDLNAELANLCRSISVLSAQCSNIQMRMALEAELSERQQQAASLASLVAAHPPRCSGRLPMSAPPYHDPRLDLPCPPGLGPTALPFGAGGNQDLAGVAAVLEALKRGYSP